PYNGSIPIVLNGHFFFFADRELWRSNGTKAGTVPVTAQISGAIGYAVLNNNLYLLKGDSLWRTDGSTAGTGEVASLNSPNDSFTGLVAFKGSLYFQASDPLHDSELWVSDGTAEGTRLFKDIKTFDTTYPCGIYGEVCTDSNSLPKNFMVHNNTLYFSANDGVHGRELWKSDGTPAGTVMVRDLRLGPEGSGPLYLVAVGNHLLFSAYDEVHGSELWRTDGTHDGTFFLKDLVPGAKSSDALHLFAAKMNDELYFTTRSVSSDSAGNLWKTDGTSNGTTVVKYGLNSAYSGIFNTYSYYVSKSAVLDGRLYSAGYLQDNNGELWVTDGTSSGTYQVKDILPGVDEYGHPYSSIPRRFVTNGDFILFGANYEVYTTPEGSTRYKAGLFKLERSTATVIPFLQLLLPTSGQ
ncbi:MAG TPA: hypothetical protein ENO11_02935, partial [Desulfobacteraceae bacterium]|nr:hypothetical protein [Desulfobacteraceae bacterium]